jgi:hypothetical protein
MIRAATPPFRLLVPALLAACAGGPSVDWESSDLRIDGSAAGDRFDSDGVRMCRSDTGDVFVAWQDARDGTSAIWLQHSPDGGQRWRRDPVRVNRGSAAATLPDLACAGATVHVVWQDIRDGQLENKNIYYNRSLDGGTTWSERDVRLSDDPDGRAMSLTPRIVRAGSEVHVAWSDARNGAYDIYVATSTDQGQTFGAPVRVDSDAPGSAFSAFPQIVADGDGAVLVVWEDARAGLSDIYAAASTNSGASFFSDIRLDGGDDAGSANSFRPRLAMSGSLAFVVWQDERNGTNRDIYFNRSSNGGLAWLGTARLVESDGRGAADSTNPTVALSGSVAHVVWQDKRNGGFDIYYRSFIQDEPRALSVEREGREPADAELRLDLGDRPGTANSLDAVIAVDGDDVAVVWEERRFDGTSGRGEALGFNEIYYNFSRDDGMTWERTDLRLDSFCQGRKYANDLQVALAGGAVLASWVDGRRGSADILFSRLPLGEQGDPAPPAACALADDG